jgi:hypothetical protein
MLRYNQSSPLLMRKASKKHVPNHTVQLYHFKVTKPELLSKNEEEFFLTLQSRLPK